MNVLSFLSGIWMATFAASGVFFLKFYRSSKDRLYLYFCLSCWLLSGERLILFFQQDAFQSIRSPVVESHAWVYFIRLAAFLTILIAVIEKNRSALR
jgi:hypothetical protein